MERSDNAVYGRLPGGSTPRRTIVGARGEGRPLDLIDLLLGPYHGANWLTDEAFRLMSDLFDRFGLPIVFFAAAAEATVLVGVVFPGVVLVFLGGVHAGEGSASLPLVIALATAGTLLGDWISYTLGRFGGQRLQSTRLGPTMRFGETLIGGRARLLIPFYHLNSVTRAVGPFGAGALRLPLRVWGPLDFVGAVIADTVWVGAGAIFGRALVTEDGTLSQHPALRVTLYVAAVGWVLLAQREVLRAYARHRTQQAAEAAPARRPESRTDSTADDRSD